MTLSDTATQEQWSAQSDFLRVLLTITHDDLEEPIRVVNDLEQLVSGGDTYLPWPFEIVFLSDLDDAPPTARLRIDNVSREIGQTIRSISSAPTIEVSLCRVDTPDTIEQDWRAYLRNVTMDVAIIEGELVLEELTREPYPAHTFSPVEYPGLIQ